MARVAVSCSFSILLSLSRPNISLKMIADEAIQIHGGMGLMEELPLERIWRDARVERIWEGTSEIQRHIISRELLRAVGG